MNKTLILVLALCLVSVHGFVKRDAPAESADGLQKMQEFGKQIKEQIENALKPEKLKEGFDNAVNELSNIVKKLQPTDSPKA